METLRGVFPAVPTEALLRVLEVCDQSVALASTWLLENDWQELMEEDEVEVIDVTNEATGNVTTATAAPPPAVTQPPAAASAAVVAPPQPPPPAQPPAELAPVRHQPVHPRFHYYARRTINAPRPLDEGYAVRRAAAAFEVDSDDDGDEGDEDDEDEDDYEEFEEIMRGEMPPLPKRTKVTKSDKSNPTEDEFWIAFDELVVAKNMIELLNTTLSKLAHHKVTLLNRPVKQMDEAMATAKLLSVLTVGADDYGKEESSLSNAKAGTDESPSTVSPPEETESPSTASVGQKRERKEEPAEQPGQGFFAHFFPISDLDMVWRSVMHAHLFNSRFGEKIEFHTASSGAFVPCKRDFDEMTQIHSLTSTSRAASLGYSPSGSLKCCLVVPCVVDEEEMLRVGRNLCTVLKLKGSLYYGEIDRFQSSNSSNSRRDTVDPVVDDEKNMTEERFRGFARYRVKKEDEAPADEEIKDTKVAADPYMGYQPPRKESYCLQVLDQHSDGGRWTSKVTS